MAATTGKGRMIRSAWHQRYNASRGVYARIDFTRAEYFGVANTSDRDMWTDWFFDAQAPTGPQSLPILVMAPLVPPTGRRI